MQTIECIFEFSAYVPDVRFITVLLLDVLLLKKYCKLRTVQSGRLYRDKRYSPDILNMVRQVTGTRNKYHYFNQMSAKNYFQLE